VRLDRVSSFGFLALALCVGKNQMCLTERWLFTMRHNGLGLGEVGEIEAQMFNKPQMLIEVRKLKFSTSAPILPNPC